MLETGSITPEQYQAAVKAPLEVAPHSVDQNDAPYFVDMLKDRLLQTYSDEELLTKRYKVYTTLDADLQSIAYRVVRDGAELADQTRAHRKRRGPRARWDPDLSPPIRNHSRRTGASLPDCPGCRDRRDSSTGGRP